jgi:mercuric ion transport protein
MKHKNTTLLLFSSLLTALSASLCCILPLLALILGASGVASASSWLEQLRPYSVVLTGFILGFAWYRKLRHQGHHCASSRPSSFLQSKMFLGITTAFSLIMLGFPYYAPLLYASASPKDSVVVEENIEEVVLAVQGMHCAGCVASLKHAIHQLPGIVTVAISLEKGTIQVQFDKTQTTPKELHKAVQAAGYTCSLPLRDIPQGSGNSSTPLSDECLDEA